ncbi:MAG: VOC family protein [Actinobacteria bacterium]|nr:VOC family protein [Actinomycetota bacterium]
MSLEWEQVVVDAAQPAALGRWWANALGWVVTFEADDEYEIRSAPDRLPGLVFVPVRDSKVTKNRLHLDFRPDDQTAEVDRLLALGAHRVDVGQGEQRWVVLADPEGNEFCVLAPRKVTATGAQFVESVP